MCHNFRFTDSRFYICDYPQISNQNQKYPVILGVDFSGKNQDNYIQ